jgi:hypothetical protein
VLHLAEGVGVRLALEYYAKSAMPASSTVEVAQGRMNLDQALFPVQDQAFPHRRAADTQFLRQLGTTLQSARLSTLALRQAFNIRHCRGITN